MEPNRTHPVDRLEREHTVIMGVLDAAEDERLLLDRGAPLNESFWHTYLDFLANYADRCHHSKEEDVLFAALEAAGLPSDSGPTSCMRMEHAEIRSIRARLKEALTSDDVETIAHLVGIGVDGLRLHIQKENEVLFPMARQLLDERAVAEVTRCFDAAEEAVGEAEYRRWETIAASLGDHVAVSSPA